MTLWIWQQMLTPHMAPLAEALARQGASVRFLAVEAMSASRQAQGWHARPPAGVETVLLDRPDAISEAIAAAPADVVHLTQGIVRNGAIGQAQRLLARRSARIWWMAEKVDRRGRIGWLKALDYRRAMMQRRDEAERLLAIGEGCAGFMADCGYPAPRIAPFAYFLDPARSIAAQEDGAPFRILFAARMIALKRFDLLVDALEEVQAPWCLTVLGDGPLAAQWQAMAHARLGERLDWRGRCSPDEVRGWMARSDLLVLPSDYDGWGAVLSEALIEGCRVIASDACGASAVVRGRGALFAAGNAAELAEHIRTSIARGQVSREERCQRRSWAQCLDADSGARYLLDLSEGKEARAPWMIDRTSEWIAA